MFEGTIFGVSTAKLLTAILIAAVWIIVGKIVYKIAKRIVKTLAKRTRNTMDDVLAEVLEGPIVLMVLLAGVWFAFYTVDFQNQTLIEWFNKIFLVVALMAGAWLVSRIATTIIKEVLVPLTAKTKSSIDDQLLPLLSKVIHVIVWAIALIIAADNLGFDVTALLAGIGIGGLAIAFAAQETISNFFGGISLIFDKSFEVGDLIKLDSGEWGVVHEITLRSTKLKTADNEIITIPNSVMAKARITNFALPEDKIRITLNIGVVYGSNPEKVRKVITQAIEKIDFVLKDPPVVIAFVEMGDFALKFNVHYWVENWMKRYDAIIAGNNAIYNALNKAKIGIPFPTQTVHLKR